MYKVMIIDDEKALRGLLKKTIHWEELGLVVAGEAASGIEAINTIDDIKPDIVFVDIKMPFMDGIEFSRIAIKRYPEMKIIILTAYDDFEYARDCIGIGICEYLLKPIVRKDIHELLGQLVMKMDKERIGLKEEDQGEDNGKVTMKHVEEYIKKHYQDTELNLTAAAREFGFNSSYLSRKFKEEMNRSFIDYLTAYRIKKAALLAREEMLMYQAAKSVGIPDPNYFGKCFKKYMNVSYTEYMKQQNEKNIR